MKKRNSFTIIKELPFWNQVKDLSKYWQMNLSATIRNSIRESWLKYIKNSQ